MAVAAGTTSKADPLTLIQLCVDYRTLLGKRDDLGMALATSDGARLVELESFFVRNARERAAPSISRRDQQRRPLKLAAQVRASDGDFYDALLADISGTGAFIETPTPLPTGARTVLRVIEPLSGREWRIAAEVAWAQPDKGMGLRFVGIPLVLRVGLHRSRPALSAA